METSELKRYVFENDYVVPILEEINCHHINEASTYWTCANHDGDNTKAITVYKEDYLGVVNYTRQMTSDNRSTDLIDLVAYETDSDFVSAIKLICNVCGLDVYHDFTEELPKSLQIIRLMKEMKQEENEDEVQPLRVLSPSVVNYYGCYLNNQFLDDHIGWITQREFGLGYDSFTNRITIPIISEFGDVVGIKGRLLTESDIDEPKYTYLERCPKGVILYGLDKTLPYIQESGEVYVFEAEKSVMQCWDFGVKNTVATGGKSISRHQADMLVRTCAKIIFCYDQDVGIEEIENIAKIFPVGVPIYCKYDKTGILKDKASPSDEEATFKRLEIVEVQR